MIRAWSITLSSCRPDDELATRGFAQLLSRRSLHPDGDNEGSNLLARLPLIPYYESSPLAKGSPTTKPDHSIFRARYVKIGTWLHRFIWDTSLYKAMPPDTAYSTFRIVKVAQSRRDLQTLPLRLPSSHYHPAGQADIKTLRSSV